MGIEKEMEKKNVDNEMKAGVCKGHGKEEHGL